MDVCEIDCAYAAEPLAGHAKGARTRIIVAVQSLFQFTRHTTPICDDAAGAAMCAMCVKRATQRNAECYVVELRAWLVDVAGGRRQRDVSWLVLFVQYSRRAFAKSALPSHIWAFVNFSFCGC